MTSPFCSAATMAALLDWSSPRAFERWAAKHGIVPFICGKKRRYDRDVVLGRFVNPVTKQPARLSKSMRSVSGTTTAPQSKDAFMRRVS
jgi:hypothetical protein